MSGRRALAGAAVALGLVLALPAARADEQTITKTWAMAEFGEPLYKDGIEHWPYANPDAPKGGKITLGSYGAFDSFNPYIIKGEFPPSIGLLYGSLMTGSADELMSAYGEIAESAEYPEDKSWIIFNLRPEARYSDGVPITAHDFKYAFDVIKEHGRPLLKYFIEEIESAEVLSDHRIKYVMTTRNSMKPLMKAADFSPVPRHFWGETHDVTKTTLDPPPSSGAYRIKEVNPGRSITYERVKDYWAADLPVNRGLNNFDEIRYDHYLDQTVMFEAFKAGQIDYRGENSAKRWKTGYSLPAVDQEKMVLASWPSEVPQGARAYFFNLRRPHFQDARVRQAIGYLYDFEAVQRTLLFGEYQRVGNFFPNSDYGSSGPPTPEELAILEPYRDQLPPEVFTEAFEPPKTDGSGRNRANLRKAMALFRDAGWTLTDGKLIDQDSGEQMTLEILTGSPETKRLTLPFIENLRRAGIDASLRLVEPAQWRSRIEQHDFDVYSAGNNFFPPPGTELRIYFGSEVEGVPNTGNRMGYSDPVVDALIDRVIAAKDLETLKATTRALDRVLLWDYIIVPQYFRDESWFAYWNKFGRPEQRPRYAIGFPTTWWLDQELEAELAQK